MEYDKGGAIAPKPEFKTNLFRMQDQYLKMVEDQFSTHRINLDSYAKECVMNAISAIQTMLEKAGMRFDDPSLDQTSLSGILRQAASLKLNAAATPREIYFQIRSENRAAKGSPDKWVKKIEAGIEGDGNDALLRNFGLNVAKVFLPWLVRENDPFKFPSHKGLATEPPEWTETGSGKVIRVVYPVLLDDNREVYLIAEREDVRNNLLAHISNNMMNETFGIAESRFKASAEQKKKIDESKRALITQIKDLALEQIVNVPAIQPWVGSTWSEAQNQEAMFIRKMRNNAIKKYPKDFGSVLATEDYAGMDETYRSAQLEIAANASREVIEITPEVGFVKIDTDTVTNIIDTSKQVALGDQEF
jgi:hypothetical protein